MTPTPSPNNVAATGAHDQEAAGGELQTMLVDLVDLSVPGKQLHRSVVGRDFRSLHLELDELVDSWRGPRRHDRRARRRDRVLPGGQARTVAATGQLGPVERTSMLTHRLGEAAERAHERMDRLGELDAASQDAVIGVVYALKERPWMVRAQLLHGRA
jgi:starvation-inducible DNA-binding protein